MRRTIYILSILCCVLASCIKEDRTGCPCYLSVDLSQVDINYIDKIDLVLSGERFNPEWISVGREYIGDTLLLKVGKSEFDFCAWGNLKDSRIDDNNRTISPAGSKDSLWSYHQRLHTKCENASVTVLPQRRYIPVTIIVRGMIQNISNVQPVIIDVSNSFDYNGNANGSLTKSTPRLQHTPLPDSEYYRFETVLTAQQSATEASLELSYSDDGQIRKASYPLARMLYESGEDFTMPDGKPVLVDLVVGSGNIMLTITTSGWQAHDTIEITY